VPDAWAGTMPLGSATTDWLRRSATLPPATRHGCRAPLGRDGGRPARRPRPRRSAPSSSSPSSHLSSERDDGQRRRDEELWRRWNEVCEYADASTGRAPPPGSATSAVGSRRQHRPRAAELARCWGSAPGGASGAAVIVGVAMLRYDVAATVKAHRSAQVSMVSPCPAAVCSQRSARLPASIDPGMASSPRARTTTRSGRATDVGHTGSTERTSCCCQNRSASLGASMFTVADAQTSSRATTICGPAGANARSSSRNSMDTATQQSSPTRASYAPASHPSAAASGRSTNTGRSPGRTRSGTCTRRPRTVDAAETEVPTSLMF
jgi:hypothetical protein